MKKKKLKPGLLWITGLSGSGKTTISRKVFYKLNIKFSNLILLDGDKLRKRLKISKKNSFSNNSRNKVGIRYINECKKLIKKRKFVIIAVMALIKKVHMTYKKIDNMHDVYLDVPLRELKKRDPKKLYKMFYQKKIQNMSGLDLKYDIPQNPSLYIKWKKGLNANRISNKIIKLIDA